MTSARRPVLLIACEGVDVGAWLEAFSEAAPEVELRVWPDAGDPQDIDFGFAWANPPGFWQGFPNLRGIFSLGAGVDALLADASLPSVSIVRMTDPSLTEAMVEFVVMRTLHHHRLIHRYEQNQAHAVWAPVKPPLAARRTVGIMGLGTLGGACARALAGFGFRVRGWSRSAHAIPGVETFRGEAGLSDFADGCEILICLLPLTPATKGVLNARLFDRLAPQACLIQAGRGPQLVEADLLAALESGRIEAATLDVFAVEPLPQDHPFWSHPKVRVIPHAAAFTYPETAAAVVAQNLRRLRAGEPVADIVDTGVGY